MSRHVTPTVEPPILEILQQIAATNEKMAEFQGAIAAHLATIAAAAANPAETPHARARHPADHRVALAAIFEGATTFAAVSRATEIPVSTLKRWPDVRDALERVTGKPAGGYKSQTGEIEAW